LAPGEVNTPSIIIWQERPVIRQSPLVGTPRCGVRTAQRAVPTFPRPPPLTDYNARHTNLESLPKPGYPLLLEAARDALSKGLCLNGTLCALCATAISVSFFADKAFPWSAPG
jgi:hypothetical protein